MYRRSVTFALFGLDSLQPSLALIFHAMGFTQTVKSLGQRAAPWSSPLRKLIDSDVSRPCFVVATSLVDPRHAQVTLSPTTIQDHSSVNL